MKKLTTEQAEFLFELGLDVRSSVGEEIRLLEKTDIKALLPKRKRNSHKGSYGKTAVVAGSVKYTGAAYLAAKAALKSGVGYTTLFTAKGLFNLYALKIPEILLQSLKGEERIEFCEKEFEDLLAYDSIAYGMGMGISEEVYLGAKYLLSAYEGKLILDADALNSIAKYGSPADFKKKKCDVLITPHPKEFSRLSGYDTGEIFREPLRLCKEFSLRYGVSVLLKGAATLLIGEAGTWVNTTGNSSQAKGGTGDVLAGTIAGLCAQGLSALDGGRVASFLVGLSAQISSADKSEYSATPTDFIENLGRAFLAVTENSDQYGYDQK